MGTVFRSQAGELLWEGKGAKRQGKRLLQALLLLLQTPKPSFTHRDAFSTRPAKGREQWAQTPAPLGNQGRRSSHGPKPERQNTPLPSFKAFGLRNVCTQGARWYLHGILLGDP